MDDIAPSLSESKKSIPRNWDFIDKVVYINLWHRRDRDEHMERMTHTFGENKVQRFSAIEHANGHEGCFKSHLAVLEMAVEHKWRNVLVLEDDADWCNFDKGYGELKRLMSNEFDVIMLGWNYGLWNHDITNGPGIQFHPTTNRVSNTFSATGYIVNQSYLEKLVSFLKDKLPKFTETDDTHLAIDQCWNPLQIDDKWFAISPAMVYQIPSNSDTDNIFSDNVTSVSSNNLNIHPKWGFIDKVVYLSSKNQHHMERLTYTFGLEKVEKMFAEYPSDSDLIVFDHIRALNKLRDTNTENVIILQDDIDWAPNFEYMYRYELLDKINSSFNIIPLYSGNSYPRQVNNEFLRGYIIKTTYIDTFVAILKGIYRTRYFLLKPIDNIHFLPNRMLIDYKAIDQPPVESYPVQVSYSRFKRR
jgi:glycosyl transferase family 25